MIGRDFIFKLSVHPSVYILFILAFITGTFLHFLILFSIIFIHELGHYMAAKHFKWNIEKITLTLFGGSLQVENNYQYSNKDAFFVTIAGPLQHVFIYGLTMLITFPPVINEKILAYNMLVLLFNLLPIYPLDGGRLLAIYLQSTYSFKLADKLSIYSSIFFIIVFFIFVLIGQYFTLHIILIMIFLLYEQYLKWRHHPYTFLLFLFHRTHIEKDLRFKKRITILVDPDDTLFSSFKKWKKEVHYKIKMKSSIFDEKACLHYYFLSNNKNLTFRELNKKYNP